MYAGLSVEVLPHLIPPNSSILAAVSGGPDSVALAHIIWRYIRENKERNLSLAITHVNHKVREESAAEAELVRSLAQEWSVSFILHEFDAKKNAYESQKSFQEASREWRYARWQEDMQKLSCNLLATAHHLGDQAETVLYRLIRGSGTTGLAGIYPRKDNVIRPLLSVSKKELLEYCHEEGLPYAMDQSNFEPVYVRNRIRLELLPQLELNYNERIQEALGRTAELLRWDEEYINAQVERLWSGYCKEPKKGQVVIAPEVWDEPKAILSRILRKAAAVITDEPRGLEYKFIKVIMENGRRTGWNQDLPGMRVEVGRNGFFFFRRELEQETLEEGFETHGIYEDFQIPLIPDRWHQIPWLGLQAGIFTKLILEPEILWSTEFDKKEVVHLADNLVCRMRRPGDKMFFEKIGHKTIKKIFQEKDVPVQRREYIPLFAYGKDVLWIPGVCRSDNFIPAPGSSERFYGLISRMYS